MRDLLRRTQTSVVIIAPQIRKKWHEKLSETIQGSIFVAELRKSTDFTAVVKR